MPNLTIQICSLTFAPHVRMIITIKTSIPYIRQNAGITERNDFMANILIVEDEKKMQDIICEYMHRGGHTCFTADDGVDALMLLLFCTVQCVL